MPCATFAGWLDEHGWTKRFTRAALPGPYPRVIEPGRSPAGDPITVVAGPGHTVSVAAAFRAVTCEPELLPLPPELAGFPEQNRAAVRRRLGAS